mmetsp:Transcript_42019/g.64362  ORF Transcript_42019/g.64362 Transcript_42019/m.64362 type:complete len:158 (+) Transcript_42019:537-1010(+)|eukprot:CAMPEP_0170491690 /NCGR_PEP_ID=MMETSP0208-20121228/11196_1 /TAXON_ID=197538 /ORGANISM="Strombidium inclinatum, Strain S3" /LENGTH=157 /DNA_ID=CAMNT_0010767307 /DNA_START=533 /DNA_END=1006 /DNA_ORIENTATION=-
MGDQDEKQRILTIIGSNKEEVEQAEANGDLAYNPKTMVDSNSTSFFLAFSLMGSPSSIDNLSNNPSLTIAQSNLSVSQVAINTNSYDDFTAYDLGAQEIPYFMRTNELLYSKNIIFSQYLRDQATTTTKAADGSTVPAIKISTVFGSMTNTYEQLDG